MALAAEDSRRTLTDASRVHPHTIGTTSRLLRAVFALALMASAANCFLKYLWWAACYSAWSGLPKFHEQWKAAGANASLNGWSAIVLELASLILVYTVIRLHRLTFSNLLRTALRVAASLTITIFATGLLALALAWVKQSH
jgi:glucan phosphoethanolaminetransferase (alkaline phosphatase superfamily)